MNQKGFANIVLVFVIIAIVAVSGYFVFVKKSEPVAQQPPAPATNTPPPRTTSPTPTLEVKQFNPDMYKYPFFAKIANQLISRLK